jgi:hypothetical protein
VVPEGHRRRPHQRHAPSEPAPASKCRPSDEAKLAKVVEQQQPHVRQLFREIDSKLVPLLLTAATVIVLPVDEALAGEPLGGADPI